MIYLYCGYCCYYYYYYYCYYYCSSGGGDGVIQITHTHNIAKVSELSTITTTVFITVNAIAWAAKNTIK